MKLSIILSSFVFANSILAAPRRQGGLAKRQELRASRIRNGVPARILIEATLVEGDNVTNVQYSSNWAGAVLTSPPGGQTFTAVSGQFTVPTASVTSSSSSGTYAASVWVGIDGDTYANAILQAGIDVSITKSGSESYEAWYEWFPNYAIDFTSFSFKAGDSISVSITSSSSTEGTVVLENLSRGESVTQSVSAPSSSSALGGQNAEWIVEDFENNGSLVPFADFGTVLFTDCVAKTFTETLGTSGATIIEMRSSTGQVLTDVTLPSSSEVEVVYE